MNPIPRTAFVCKPIGAGQIRGVQIAAALGCDVVPIGEGLTPDAVRDYDVLVYAKELPPTELMRAVHRRGARQILDVVDNYRWRKLARCAPFADALIGANLTHAVELRRRFGRPAVEIPHHHCNLEELRIPPGRTPPTLGYVGRKEEWRISARAVRKLPYPLVSDLAHRELVATYLRIDIGFAFRKDPLKRSFNSAVKLLNYLSFGIPAVVAPESGFLEVARHGEECLFAQTPAELAMLIEHLAADPELRRRMGEAAFEAGRPFHIRCVAERYRALLRDV